MKKIALFLSLLLGVLFLFIIYTMSSTGYFRSIEGSFDVSLMKKVNVKGPEDIVIAREDAFLIVSSDDRAGHRDKVAETSCGLYLYDLQDDKLEFLQVDMNHAMHPHGIDMWKIDSGVYRLLIVNHVQKEGVDYSIAGTEIHHYIEELRLEGRKLTHIRTYESPSIKSPNDVTIVNETQFYFTNDHGSDTELGLLAEDYLGLRRSGVVYFDGNDYKHVVDGMAYANGIAYAKDRNLLFVASPRDFLVKVFSILEDGDLEFIEDILCGTGVDNIDIDTKGKLWIGCHPSLLHFSSYALGKSDKAPSEIITIDYRGFGDFEVRSIVEDDGTHMSAATIAIPYNNQLYLGNVMDDHMVILQDSK